MEAILNALLERVGVHRRPEVMNVGNVLGFLRRGGRSDLGCGGKVFEDFSPGRILSGARPAAVIRTEANSTLLSRSIKNLFEGPTKTLMWPGDSAFQLGLAGSLVECTLAAKCMPLTPKEGTAQCCG
jgi:hypothetical protein